MDKTKYYKVEKMQAYSFPEAPIEDLGFDYNSEDNYVITGETWLYNEGMVSIDALINKLNEFKKTGANYVACEYHCDHQEFDIQAAKFRELGENEVADHLEILKSREEKLKQDKINNLQREIENLKNG